MKKTLLTAAMTVIAATSFAQTSPLGTAAWEKSVNPVSEADQLGGVHSAVAADGSVYTTGTYNQGFTFGSSTLTNENQITSAYIAKYDAEGNQLWAQGFTGSSIIRTVTTDADGNVYVAGNLAGEVTIPSVAGEENKTLTGMDQWGDYITDRTTGFVVKYDKDGKLVAAIGIKPVAGDAATASGMYFDNPQFIPAKILVSGDKVVLAATYYGNLTLDNVSWTGRYTTTDLGEGMIYYQDADAAGVLTLNAADLSGAASLAEIGQKGAEAADAYNRIRSIDITTDGTDIYVAAVGQGDLTFTNAAGEQEINYAPDAVGNSNYGFIVSNLSKNVVKSYEAGVDTLLAPVYSVDGLAVDGENLYIAGIVSNKNPFAGEDYQPTGATDAFVAALSTSDLSQKAAWHDSYNEGDTRYYSQNVNGIAISDGKVYVAGYAYSTSNDSLTAGRFYTLDEATLTGDVADYVVADLTTGSNVIVASTVNSTAAVTSVYSTVANGIAGVNAAENKASDKIYNIEGQQVSGSYKGLVIIGGKKYLKK